MSLSFLVDTMDKRRGGCGPNIAYTLALLGERPRLMGTAGQDFGEYRQWLEAAGVDTSLVAQVPGKFTASFFCSTDQDNNQIASFYTGAMSNAGELSFREAGQCDLAIISPNDPGAMLQYTEECRTLSIPFIFDPGQQCARMSGSELSDGIAGATWVICNDYEFELIRQKTGLQERDIASGASVLIVTKGEHGCSILTANGQIDVPAVEPHRIEDPTGVGDAFRAGLMKGLSMGADLKVAHSSAASLRRTRSNTSAAPTTPSRGSSSHVAMQAPSGRSVRPDGLRRLSRSTRNEERGHDICRRSRRECCGESPVHGDKNGERCADDR